MVVELNRPYHFDEGVATFISEDIMLVRFTGKSRVGIKDMTNIRNLRFELIGNSPYYPIIDCRDGFISFTTEAKAWVAVNKESAKVRQMDVLLVNNWATKIEAQLYLRMFKPLVKTKIASSLETALELIEKQKAAAAVDAL